MRAICHYKSDLQKKMTQSTTSRQRFLDDRAVAQRIQLYKDYLQGNDADINGVINLLNQVITFLQGYLNKKFQFNESSNAQTSEISGRKLTKKSSLSFFSRESIDSWIKAKLAPFLELQQRLRLHHKLIQGLTVKEVQDYILADRLDSKSRRSSEQTTYEEMLSGVVVRRGSGPDWQESSSSSLQPEKTSEGPK